MLALDSLRDPKCTERALLVLTTNRIYQYNARFGYITISLLCLGQFCMNRTIPVRLASSIRIESGIWITVFLLKLYNS